MVDPTPIPYERAKVCCVCDKPITLSGKDARGGVYVTYPVERSWHPDCAMRYGDVLLLLCEGQILQ